MQVRGSRPDATQEFRKDAFPDRAQPGAGGRVGSILILRDAFSGLTRFDQFQENLGIAPNMLTRRLNSMVS
jgi:hypothetical protein